MLKGLKIVPRCDGAELLTHHTLHLFTGFILEPSGHLKSLLKSSKLENGPITRNWPGESKPVVMWVFRVSNRYLEHHMLAALIQNICSGVYSCRPGSLSSTLLCFAHSLYALYEFFTPPLSAMFSHCVLMPFIWKKIV